MRTTTTKMKTMTYDEHEDSVVGVDSDESWVDLKALAAKNTVCW